MGIGPTGSDLPLAGIRVLDFAQFLAGPVCALRLADLGAEVIKVERPEGGDLCRRLAVADRWSGDDSLLFKTINRGKRSVAADLKKAADLEMVRALIATAHVMIHNFRPGVMERIGLGFEAVRAFHPRIVYGVVSGYGTSGPWRDLPGQDLLVQARSGLAWLTGSADDPPIPTGVSIADLSAGQHLAQGILAALVRQATTGRGSLVEVSLLASAMDVQFEQFTTWLNGGDGAPPRRSAVSGANVHANAPYGIFQTADGHIALAMTPLAGLAGLLSLDLPSGLVDPARAFADRDAIKARLRDHLATAPTRHWVSILEPAGVWCAAVLDWPALQATGALESLGVIQDVEDGLGGRYRTTACPVRLDGRVLANATPAPRLGADTADIMGALRSAGATG